MAPFRKILISCAVVSLTACATTSVPTISDRDGASIIERFQAVSTSAKDPKGPPGVVAWLQPKNKRIDCKVYFADTPLPGNKPFWELNQVNAYWDGDCKNGFAFGVGREFVESPTQGLRSSLAVYAAANTKPEYVYESDYDDHQFVLTSDELGPDRNSGSFAAQKIAINNVGKHDFTIHKESLLKDFDNEVIYIIHDHFYTGRRGTLKHYKNGSMLRADTSSNPADQLSMVITLAIENNPVVSISKARDGRVFHQKFNGLAAAPLVRLPQNLVNFMLSEAKSTENHVGVIGKRIALAERFLSIYKRRICKGDISVDFVDDAIYGQICLPGGDLAPFSDEIAAYEQKQKTLWAEAEYRSREQQKIAAQNQRAAAQQAQLNRAETYGAISEFNRSMQQLSNNASSFTQNYMNQSQPQVNFGGAGAVTTNCLVVSNIVRCKSH